MICHMVPPRDTKTPSENRDGVLVSRPRCARTRPKARAGFAALRLAARFGRVRAFNHAVAQCGEIHALAKGIRPKWRVATINYIRLL
jgi:hypothetical protein